jgi:large subunit ribosomal protein L18
MIKKTTSKQRRRKRHRRVRLRIKGTAERPRLNVFRSLKHIYAQVIDDIEGRTMASASSLETAIREVGGTKSEVARSVGELIGQRALAEGISEVVFDRGGYKYHGRVKALAEGARKAGLEF